MNIAILGANGFLGRYLTTTLTISGHEVTGFVLNPKQNSTFGYHEKSIHELLNHSTSKIEKFDVKIFYNSNCIYKLKSNKLAFLG